MSPNDRARLLILEFRNLGISHEKSIQCAIFMATKLTDWCLSVHMQEYGSGEIDIFTKEYWELVMIELETP